jgi:hypothetical protein
LVVGLQSVSTSVPALQVAHVLQLLALVPVLYLPAGQVAQVRFVVADPAAEMYWPALQVVLETQVVAGLPSWSQVPAAHGTSAAVPPAQ